MAAEREEENLERRVIEVPIEEKCKQTKTLKRVLKVKDCEDHVEEEIIPYVVKEDNEKKEIKFRKKMAIDAEREEENQKASVETKLEQVIEHHDEIGKVLEGIKE